MHSYMRTITDVSTPYSEHTVPLNVGTSTVEDLHLVHTSSPGCANFLNYSSLDYLEYMCGEFISVLLLMYYACHPSAFEEQDNGIMFRSGAAIFDIIEHFFPRSA